VSALHLRRTGQRRMGVQARPLTLLTPPQERHQEPQVQADAGGRRQGGGPGRWLREAEGQPAVLRGEQGDTRRDALVQTGFPPADHGAACPRRPSRRARSTPPTRWCTAPRCSPTSWTRGSRSVNRKPRSAASQQALCSSRALVCRPSMLILPCTHLRTLLLPQSTPQLDGGFEYLKKVGSTDLDVKALEEASGVGVVVSRGAAPSCPRPGGGRLRELRTLGAQSRAAVWGIRAWRGRWLEVRAVMQAPAPGCCRAGDCRADQRCSGGRHQQGGGQAQGDEVGRCTWAAAHKQVASGGRPGWGGVQCEQEISTARLLRCWDLAGREGGGGCTAMRLACKQRNAGAGGGAGPSARRLHAL
jgi:hypothetical protein